MPKLTLIQGDRSALIEEGMRCALNMDTEGLMAVVARLDPRGNLKAVSDDSATGKPDAPQVKPAESSTDADAGREEGGDVNGSS